MHWALSQQLLISKRANLPCEAVQSSFKIDQRTVFSNRDQRESSVVTIYDLRMSKAASDISVIVNELDRTRRYKTIYRTLDVTEQKNHRSDKMFMKDASLQHSRDMTVCYNDVNRNVRQKKRQDWERRVTERKNWRKKRFRGRNALTIEPTASDSNCYHQLIQSTLLENFCIVILHH